MVIDAFNDYFDPEKKKNYQISCKGQPIAPVINQFIKDSSDISLKRGENWKVEISKIVKKNFKAEDLDETHETMWVKLFEAFQKKSET